MKRMRSAALLWFKGEHFIFITLKMGFKTWYFKKKKKKDLVLIPFSPAASVIWLFRNSMCRLNLVEIDLEDPVSFA